MNNVASKINKSVAFYSYKGGVGRTQLVANLASYLYLYENKKVLLMDWDLEAPGLHFYFKNPTENRFFQNEDFKTEGLIEMLQEYVRIVRSRNPEEIQKQDLPRFEPENIVSMLKNEETGAKIDLIPAGTYQNFAEYRRKVIDFNWFEFYEMLDGIRYLEFMIKPQLKDELGYDFVFIDSRTGISDYQNISNVQMADINVVLIAPNMQNLEGCMAVAKSIMDSPYVKEGRRKPIVMPVLSRVEVDSPDFKAFDKEFRKQCKPMIENLKTYMAISENTYYEDTRLYYNKYIAIGEHLLFQNKDENIDGFAKQIENIANYLAHGEIKNRKAEEWTEKVKEQVIKGNIEKALNILLKYAQKQELNDLENETILLLARYNDLNVELKEKIISFKAYNLEKTKIRKQILLLIS